MGIVAPGSRLGKSEGGGTVMVAVPTVLVVALFFVPRALASGRVDAAVLAGQLTHRAVVLEGSTIVGDLDLSHKRVHGFSCHNCRVEGSFLASRARMNGKLDLTGSEVTGDVVWRGATLALVAPRARFDGVVDLRGATLGSVRMSQARFEAPLLAGDTATTTTFGGLADFALADFASRVTFENAAFQNANFRFATFGADSVFAGVQAAGDAIFARTIFRGALDFSSSQFDRTASFQGADFEGSADFSFATFSGDVSFDQGRFVQGATFRAAIFSQPGQAPRVELTDFVSRSDLDFDFAEFDRRLNFSNVVVSGTLSFSNANFAVSRGVRWYRVKAQDLDMSVGDTLRAVDNPTDQKLVLSKIEASAKAHGDLGLANNALYARQELKSDRYWLPWRVLDFAFYRWVAGYLVRPLRPLAWLLLLALVASILRDATFKERRKARLAELQDRKEAYSRLSRSRKLGPRDAGARIAAGSRDLSDTVADTARALRDTLFLIVPGGGRSEARKGREGEIFLYGILLACALVGFANSNPTLRQMFDAIH
jgi:uncharacterized protein YjbI with pentapeptide repeats